MGRLGDTLKSLLFSPDDRIENLGYDYVDGDRRCRIYQYKYRGTEDIPVMEKGDPYVKSEFGVIKEVRLDYNEDNDGVDCRARYIDFHGNQLPYVAKLSHDEMVVFMAKAKQVKDEVNRGRAGRR